MSHAAFLTEHLRRRRQLLKGALGAALPFGMPAMAGAAQDLAPLAVGGLPVTCNLTLPIACVAKADANARAGLGPAPFVYNKYSG